ncbi:uncharacterized protein LOC118816696 [Colossoma macropomum]|uniref:uncharacterized protein LOC118816696 n=1 Tax=Colossoma macropomum TaxID=42526 RepID=UPI0018652AB7|nr:uncharacterized protein LOC118816696 [Colossoma macropomum]
MKQLPGNVKEKLQRLHALSTLKARNYICWLKQVRCRPGGFMEAMKAEVERLDREKKRHNKFCSPHWPPVISVTERERRKRFRRELEKAQSAQAKKRRRKGSKPVPVTRCTVYRRKKTVEEDNRILEEAGTVHHQQAPAGLPCNLCGQPKRLEFGHATYKGTSFCSNTSGQSAHDWLTEQRRKAGENKGRRIPKSTAWNMKRRRQKEQEAEELGISLKERKRPGYQICQLCGQPRQKAYGHSRYKGVPFCSAYEGKSVELWLAEQRTADREGRPVQSRSGRK